MTICRVNIGRLPLLGLQISIEETLCALDLQNFGLKFVDFVDFIVKLDSRSNFWLAISDLGTILLNHSNQLGSVVLEMAWPWHSRALGAFSSLAT